MTVIRSELTFNEIPSVEAFEQPSAKRIKLEFVPQTLWEQLKTHWNAKSGKTSNLNDLAALFRIAVVGMKIKLRCRESSQTLDERDIHLFNSRITDLLATCASTEFFELICEYLDSCIPLTYVGFDRAIGQEWMILSALPWLPSVSTDLDPKWSVIARDLAPVIGDRWGKFADCFVKFPTAFYKQWAIDIGAEILKTESCNPDSIIPLVPWIVRHGKVFRDLLSDLMTRILASGSPSMAAELTRYGSDIVCALSGRANVVNPPDEGLNLRCIHNADLQPMKLVSQFPEDIGLFLLEFVFDENDHPVRWRIELLHCIMCHVHPHTESLKSTVRKKLRNLTSRSITENRPILQRTVLKACIVLVHFWTDVIIADCLHVLFQLILTAYSPLMVCWISNSVKEIASHMKLSPDVLFSRNTVIICDILLSNNDLEWRINFISLAPEMFHFASVSHCLNLMLPALLPKLVLEFPAGPNPFFDEICSILRKSSSEVLGKFFSCIYTHLLLHCSQQEQTSVITHIENLTCLKMLELRAPNIQTVYNDLLSQFHTHRERIMEAFHTFAAEDKGVPKHRRNCEPINDYLRPRFLGFFVHLDSRLISKSVSDQVKIEALASLPCVFQLMGTANVTAVRLKILATLRTGLQLNYDPFHQLNATAWESFVRHIDIKELGPLVSQITVSVLPLHQYCSETIRSILYYIVVENGQELKDHLKNIHFLPEQTGKILF